MPLRRKRRIRAIRKEKRRISRPKLRREWISAPVYHRRVVEKYEIEYSDGFVYRTWFHPSTQLLTKRRHIPPDGPHTRYIVFRAWYLLFDSDEGTHSLYMRSRDIRRGPTGKDYMRVFEEHPEIEEGSIEDAFLHLPVELRIKRGLLWQDVLRNKARWVNAQMEELANEKGYQDRQVKGLVAWAVYAEPISYNKKKRTKRKK